MSQVGHDPHILYTLSAVQVLALFDKLDVPNIDKVSNYICGLQNEDGSFSGDMWGEVDTQFSYIAVCCLSILHWLEEIDVDKAVNYIFRCKNLDGGFGSTPSGKSHAGQRLSLLEYPELKAVDPVNALSVDVVNRIFFGK